MVARDTSLSHFKVIDHKLVGVEHLQSSHCQVRDAAEIELVVLHCISLPEDEFGTGAPARLFTGQLDCTEHLSYADLEGVRVSAHLLIERDGNVQQFVPFDQAAWHAGESSWCGRPGCNDYSIGVELEGSVSQSYESAQYLALTGVLYALIEAYPGLSVGNIVGHADVAPGRKFDPGPYFDWRKLYSAVHALLSDSQL